MNKQTIIIAICVFLAIGATIVYLNSNSLFTDKTQMEPTNNNNSNQKSDTQDQEDSQVNMNADFENIIWQLTDYYSESNQSMYTIPTGIILTSKFMNNEISGSSGCNQYFGNYTYTAPNNLQIGQVGGTMMACDEARMLIESEFLSNLQQTSFYIIEGGYLKLLNNSDQIILMFSESTDITLENTQWKAISMNNGKDAVESLPEDIQITALFTEGQLSGTAGCNNYNTTYSFGDPNGTVSSEDAPMLVIDDMIATTKMYCEGKMEAENQYLSLLKNVASYDDILNNTLTLRDANGAMLIQYVATD